ncbi:NUDIX domain-containing protein [Aureimonas endophytica]|uniref:NUDIX domain-containing protein n=1 Tax=Aureimonas endophytica TaxID=2027858 RepID=A0A917EC97_9HYPH|nr:NUDIX hydrolase [Aureimonas endophytica]GGE18898.1 NUDIX domain-containing protein [Aureimonas endophytica]
MVLPPSDPHPAAAPSLDGGHDFLGAKLALLLGDDLLVYRRDRKEGIPFPGCWDLPGGGREGGETPAECALRELREEFGLSLPRERILYARAYASTVRPGAVSWFLAGRLRATDVGAIVFGEEGEEWQLMPIATFRRDPEAVPYLRDRLGDYLLAGHAGTED